MNQIEKVSKKTFKKPRLFGWGKNDYCQLGLNTGNIIVNHPMGVSLPEFEKDDQIKHIECGWRASVIITQKGNVWMTEIPPRKIQKEKEEKEKEEDQPAKGEKGKKKKKESVEIPEEKKTDKPHSKWVDLTQKCGTLKYLYHGF